MEDRRRAVSCGEYQYRVLDLKGWIRIVVTYLCISVVAISVIRLASRPGALARGLALHGRPVIIRRLMLAGSRQIVLRRWEIWMRFLAQDEATKPSICGLRQRFPSALPLLVQV